MFDVHVWAYHRLQEALSLEGGLLHFLHHFILYFSRSIQLPVQLFLATPQYLKDLSGLLRNIHRELQAQLAGSANTGKFD